MWQCRAWPSGNYGVKKRLGLAGDDTGFDAALV